MENITTITQKTVYGREFPVTIKIDHDDFFGEQTYQTFPQDVHFYYYYGKMGVEIYGWYHDSEVHFDESGILRNREGMALYSNVTGTIITKEGRVK